MLLARAGVRVLLLDRQEFPRPKPCGDCLSAAGTAVLGRLGVLDSVLALPHARLRGWRIVSPDGAEFRTCFSDIPAADAVAIERRVLDAALVRGAIAAGADYRAPAHVTSLGRAADGRVTGVVLRDGSSHRASLVIGADGLRSVVASRLGAVTRTPRLRKLSLTFHLPEAIPTDGFGEMHVAAGCCVGLSPVGAARTNITVVIDARGRERIGPADACGLARAVIASMPALRGRIPRDLLAATPYLASGPFDRPVRHCVFDGAALVGDAAGYYDPFTGQGIFQALIGAELLVRTALSTLAAGDTSAAALEPYSAQRAAALRGSRLVQEVLEAVLSRPALASRTIARIRRAAPFASALLAVTGDVARPAHLLSFPALASLILPSGG